MRATAKNRNAGSRAERILARVRAIPEGFVQTYRDVDPDAPRYGGRVLAEHHRAGERSSNENIPWHRVVRADGSVPLGAPQIALLRQEGVPLTGERVDLRRARLPHEPPCTRG